MYVRGGHVQGTYTCVEAVYVRVTYVRGDVRAAGTCTYGRRTCGGDIYVKGGEGERERERRTDVRTGRHTYETETER